MHQRVIEIHRPVSGDELLEDVGSAETALRRIVLEQLERALDRLEIKPGYHYDLRLRIEEVPAARHERT